VGNEGFPKRLAQDFRPAPTTFPAMVSDNDILGA
jgi:hypothetical protein